ncbi:MAG: hypothetical protein UY20_C0001G0030 [Candidatus Yanofskybacteria bacterium GW2011_GWA1_48_10]|uniref:Glycosyltransferase 2-like domain-containing protein n=2 Tax=Candidatus Yanofskyibacteriota TaxID=1752733 RepID=A0A0G1U7X7_9BACT|nr:MAG: hypothetical protein UY20_C0001G0030 [Candidatus Yanofskybacteria bacterium GW2011_GWA1_48_10]OGN06599.1 MAG: hypothetical protein A2669_03070 [Candidatus Yanofskybacteria bacterium RIFCSPHIGHO2_01_FULL_48_25b]
MLSIIILSYRAPEMLRLCLSSLSKSLPKDLNAEIIVVDNQSSLETQFVAEDEFKRLKIKLIPLTENEGYTRAVNRGIEEASGEYILYSNHDVVFQPNFFKTLVSYLENSRDVGLVGPKLLNFNGSRQDSCFRFYSPWTIICRRMPFIPRAGNVVNRFLMRDLDLSKPRSVDWISGAVFMTTKAAIRDVGLMDENLFHYFSDVDWARRFWENGYKVVYFPEAKVYHYHGRSSRGRFGPLEFIFNRAARWHLFDGIKYFLKYGIGSPRNLAHD